MIKLGRHRFGAVALRYLQMVPAAMVLATFGNAFLTERLIVRIHPLIRSEVGRVGQSLRDVFFESTNAVPVYPSLELFKL